MNTCSFFSNQNSKFEWMFSKFPIINQQYQLTDEFNVVRNGVVKQRQFHLINNYLIIKSKKGKTKWVNYENAKLAIVNDDLHGYGLSLQKGNDKFDFFGDVEIWFNSMRRFAIQSDFDFFYVLEKQIGSGSFSQVFLARNKYDGHEYAVKYILKKEEIVEIDKQQLVKEISILRQLQHQSIIKLHETFETSDAVYLVMEYFKGGDFLQFIEEKQDGMFTEEQIAIIIYKLLKVIHYLHQKGIMHRDLKPENILFKEKGVIESLCLGDFGLADFYNKEGNYLFTRCGTPGYVAPELLQDQQYDYKVDIFSIGIIMFILLTGKEPFQGDYHQKVQSNYFGNIDLSNIKNLTDIGKDFLRRILQVNPQKRLNANQALYHYWFQMFKLAKPMLLNNNNKVKSMKRLSQIEIKNPSLNTLALISPRLSRQQSKDKDKGSLPLSPNPHLQNCFTSRQQYSPRMSTHFTLNSLVLANKEKQCLRSRIQNLMKY
ncbi:unnamed protein product (macronuclear) [Paramecium tetraurelia]|uniref:non-specific serine/threonine protein kinase n=1 Tax=Paramecium tetraurelia TaxID=5888 RepID=A0CD50_PARTE|nr:uncharacterized protein GSPATT00006928001 [Paramecium tetraurelia]CAK68717.1 unnamed protein product [Paramecium tetraurelia]|eukprot:XP_001436114.1 hypothetical protein (macronuclear) [Paramecium tetraurelia strain d4-2]